MFRLATVLASVGVTPAAAATDFFGCCKSGKEAVPPQLPDASEFTKIINCYKSGRTWEFLSSTAATQPLSDPDAGLLQRLANQTANLVAARSELRDLKITRASLRDITRNFNTLPENAGENCTPSTTQSQRASLESDDIRGEKSLDIYFNYLDIYGTIWPKLPLLCKGGLGGRQQNLCVNMEALAQKYLDAWSAGHPQKENYGPAVRGFRQAMARAIATDQRSTTK